MSLVPLVNSALKATSPIVGIPLEGEQPFAIRRDLLINSLKGLKIIDAAIQLHLETGKPHQLIIYASGKNVQAIRKFNVIDSRFYSPWGCGTLRHYLGKWAREQREKRAASLAAPKIRVSARVKQITKLKKQLVKLGEPKPPIHPFLDSRYNNTAESIREHDAKQLKSWEKWRDEGPVGFNIEKPLTIGQQWEQWKREARIRKWINLQGRLCKSGKFTTTQLYRILSDRGVKVKKWSSLNSREKERCSNPNPKLPERELFGYLAILWEFCSLSSKPGYDWFSPEPPSKAGKEHYEYWLDWLHEWKELQSTISALELIESEQTEAKQAMSLANSSH